MARPVEQLVNVVHGELRGRGGVELHISRPGRGTYRLWISDRELPEVIRKLSTVQNRDAVAPRTG